MPESDTYPGISKTLKSGLAPIMTALGPFSVDFEPCGSVDLYTGLRRIAAREGVSVDSLMPNIELARELKVDIVGNVRNVSTNICVQVICEVKKDDPLRLNHLAQLIGYCIASKVPYGLLIGANSPPTAGFNNVLRGSPHLTEFVMNGVTQHLSICDYNIEGERITVHSYGRLNSLTLLARSIARKLQD
ncbi:MAG: hypothetical protein A4E31_00297 [Methanomassiliicoccales archaeon PtaU1.Bin030]|nr:MAG: hypothetical protein A4E31_00297 [Methanomassiliicoccales archaeon PtaU1.Bin030]